MLCQPPYATSGAAISATKMPNAKLDELVRARLEHHAQEHHHDRGDSRAARSARSPRPAARPCARWRSATARPIAGDALPPGSPDSAIVPVKPWPSQAPKPARCTETSPNGVLDVGAARVPVEEEHRDQQHDARRSAAISLAASRLAQVHRSPPGSGARPASGPTSPGPHRAGGLQRVLQQHRDRHRPDAPGHGRDRPRALGRPPRSRRRPPGPSSVRFMPTSITVAPGLHHLGRRPAAGCPTAATSTSARRHTSPRSRVREWQTVTVAFSASSSEATGLPTRSLRPTTTASAPSSGGVARAQQLDHARRRRRHQRRLGPGRAGRRSSASARRRPCAGRSRRSSRAASRWPGSGSWTRIPLHRRSRRSARSRRSSSSSWPCVRGQLVPDRADADLGAGLVLAGHVDRARPRRRRPARSPARAPGRARRRSRSTSALATSRPDAGGDRLAVDDRRAGIGQLLRRRSGA